ncbi:hypothetical protein CAC42_1928 [Sphaceloma murrayae]|uniref:Uncharacterized protein n=1 Tax=Sphaceloma murrayae TaxID=2082308 RepID=A0A2K1QLX8_9PEZI|nr:hypothetical protein CAC42_1928 [Sphaceloma murrayae]
MAQENQGHLPFFASPLVRRESGTDYTVDPRTHAHFRRTSRSRSQTLSLNNVQDLSDVSLDDKDAYSLDSPIFKRHTEATHSELFYDLFFVANLTVFSSVKEINDRKTLSQYTGFFTILWMTWYQVSLYDVRFSKDSIFDRIAKAVQFGVMIGFAINGPTFDVGEKLTTIMGLSSDDSISIIADPNLTSFKSLTLIMMASRLVLVLQYLQAIYLTRKQRDLILPMAMIAGTEFIAGIVYFGLFFSFHNLHANAYITWYAVALLETTICTAVSSVWRNISFKGTHLTQRMSLLTLIILGEGIIGLGHKCQEIVKGQIFGFTSSTIANIFCCVLIIYFLYMLYFDPLSHQHFGSIRQQIWSLLHYPLHLALLLTLSGANQFIALRAATIRIGSLLSRLPTLTFTQPELTSTSTIIEDDVNQIILAAFHATQSLGQTLHYAKCNATAYTGLDVLRSLNNATFPVPSTTTSDPDALPATLEIRDEPPPDLDSNIESRAFTATELVYSSLISAIYTAIGFSTPSSEKMTSLLSAPTLLPASSSSAEGEEETAAAAAAAAAARISETISLALEEMVQENEAVYEVARLIYVYFFVALGLSILLMGTMQGVEKSKFGLELGDRIRLGTIGVVGALLGLLAVLETRGMKDEGGAGQEGGEKGSLGTGMGTGGWRARGSFDGFLYSAWVLPTAMLGLLVVVIGLNVKLPGSPASVRRAFRRGRRRTRHSF